MSMYPGRQAHFPLRQTLYSIPSRHSVSVSQPTSPPTRRRQQSTPPPVGIPYPIRHAQTPVRSSHVADKMAEQSVSVEHRSPTIRRRQTSPPSLPEVLIIRSGRYPAAHAQRRVSGSQRLLGMASWQSAWSRHGDWSARWRRRTQAVWSFLGR